LLPWGEILGEKSLQAFFVTIKLKLTSALTDWQPNTKENTDFAKALLVPWIAV
jgi:hypothetical protein